MKHFLLAIAACLALCATAQEANVYASGLKATQVEGNKYNISFVLNAPATAVDLLIGEQTFNLGAGVKGVNNVEVTLDGVTGENLNWSLKATGEPNTSDVPIKVEDKSTNENLDFYYARSIAIDNDVESPYFGRIYVAESGHGASSRTSNGLYVFNAAFEDFTEQGAVPYAGNAGFEASSASPQRVFVAKDALYLCDWSDSHPGVWKANPADLTQDFTPIFGGENYNGTGLLVNRAGGDSIAIAGSIVSIWVEGEGENTVLYTFDEDYVGPAGFTKTLLQYNIGNAENPWVQAPSAVVFDNTEHLEQNGSTMIIPDATGWWISQYRWTEAAELPALIHFNTSTNAVDFNSATANPDGLLVGNSQIGGLAINEEGTLLAIANNDGIKVFEMGETSDGAPLLTPKYAFLHGMANNRVWSLAFDVAGNLYQANDMNAGLAIFAMPTDDNSYTTPAPVDQTITVASYIPSVFGDVTGDDSVDISDDNAVINVMLGKGTVPEITADVNGDGIVDIFDVNMVINAMLGME
ncbi:MAG: hypothetical protein IKX39_03460 [Muribaculaceae bacterium]|nr:hypothetical protein [Muribaculaceae bacterium]